MTSPARAPSPWPSIARTSIAGARSRGRATVPSRATCWAAWNEDGLYLTIDVAKPDVWFRPPDAPPLLLDNEPDDINSDGVQVYVRPLADGPVFGWLIVPEKDAALRVSGAGGTSGTPEMVDGSWEHTDDGYRINAGVRACPAGSTSLLGDTIGFDLLVNEMRPGRQRRAGQLVWSGDGGWVWLRGDRHDPARFGRLELRCAMTEWPVAGFTSTGSKHPQLLYGEGDLPGVPLRMLRSAGCRIWDANGREFIDSLMALGAVALGYGHPEVNRRQRKPSTHGVVGSLAPVLEAELADDLRRLMPHIEQVRFLKTGAEGCAAAVRLARAYTNREMVLGCGYHGWLDWTSSAAGVPGIRSPCSMTRCRSTTWRRRAASSARSGTGSPASSSSPSSAPSPIRPGSRRSATRPPGPARSSSSTRSRPSAASPSAAPPSATGWSPTSSCSARRWPTAFPLAAVGGRQAVMERVADTWISSTLATEFLSLAAARACLGVMEREKVPATLHRTGTRLLQGLGRLAGEFPDLVTRAVGVPEMCHLEYRDDAIVAGVAVGVARRGVLWKRSAYNFVSLAHDDAVVDQVLGTLAETLRDLRK